MSQDYVIEVPGQYPRKCLFRIFGEDRIKQFNIQQGEDLTVQFDIDAHEFNGRQMPVAGQPMAGAPMAAPGMPQATPFPPADGATAPFPPAQEPAAKGSADDLPF